MLFWGPCEEGGSASFHVNWVFCNHVILRPQVEVAGHGLQIQRVASNMLNTQSQIADKK
jgi:hypothetical protein